MKWIRPSNIEGAIDAPPSKSIMQRAVIAAALADGESLITNASFCEDALATINVVQSLGAKVQRGDKKVKISGNGKPLGPDMDCGESGTCMRMISAVAALYDKEFTITGRGSLMTRPVDMIEKPLKNLGVACKTNNGLPPLKIKGPMHGGKLEINGAVTSQFVSGLLMALPLCKEDSDIEVHDLKSHAYVSLTESVLHQFGIHIRIDEKMNRFLVNGNQRYLAREYKVDGDWSGAAFMLVAGAIAGNLEIRNLGSGIQPDQSIKTVLLHAGADIEFNGEDITIHKSELSGFEYDATGSPDLFPPLAVLACNCKGKSVIYGTERLKHKESDRASVLVQELRKLGAEIKLKDNRMEIIGKKLKGGEISAHGDHRIAMAGAIAALNSENGVEIDNEKCVAKSYPEFFKDLEEVTK
ncbi:3-phosphoshikimate 1-carboxyvinyltransferase [Candidatus Micrarchaeota archaeon]|nr:3-phosphoshikimate 1-carboxyvinyltransferase [Candidatus Micrarchaeota archaeon]